MRIAQYAVDPEFTRGRLYEQDRDDFRNPFQRDRDRIVHSTGFRRLANKTQVFVSHEGDLFRSRLTHSLEVAQVARALARRLRVNEDLAEAVALSHDLGHPPFGHTGEDTLELLMENYGGFDHNAQALRIVTKREERYAAFAGLNLTWETLEGMAKHNGPIYEPYPWAIEEFNQAWDLELWSYASLEAQIAAIADDIAYNHHDLQDGLRSGLITDSELMEIPLLRRAFVQVEAKYPNASRKIKRYETLSRLFSAMVENVYETSVRNLEFNPTSANDIRNHSDQIVKFSDEFFGELKVLRAFLFAKLYRHPQVMEMRETASLMLTRVFEYAFEHPETLPKDWREGVDIGDDQVKARLVSDYVSGMTDSFVSREWFFAHGLNWDKS